MQNLQNKMERYKEWKTFSLALNIIYNIQSLRTAGYIFFDLYRTIFALYGKLNEIKWSNTKNGKHFLWIHTLYIIYNL